MVLSCFYDFHLTFSQNFQKLAKKTSKNWWNSFILLADLEKVKKTLDFVTVCTTWELGPLQNLRKLGGNQKNIRKIKNKSFKHT